jgi:glycosyltransferase involved in cell wall biosynthesis
MADTPLTVGFAVTTTDIMHGAGDLYTAMGLGEALQKLYGWNVRYLDKGQWAQAEGLDIYIAMRDRTDVSALDLAKPSLVKIAWMRSWVDRWVERPWVDRFDFLLASSEKGAEFARDRTGREVQVLPIAASTDRFYPGPRRPEYAADYVFTGNYWGVVPPREIEAFDPSALPYKFKIFGKNWDTHPSLSQWASGFAAYTEMAAIYNSSIVTVDDAVIQANKRWGSVNSRVFEALAAGSLVVTNDEFGSRELFSGGLPIWRSASELIELIDACLRRPELTHQRAKILRDEVLARHTYDLRARRFHDILRI